MMQNPSNFPPEDKEKVKVDPFYELKAYSKEKIDYDYIVNLIQTVVSATEEERALDKYQRKS